MTPADQVLSGFARRMFALLWLRRALAWTAAWLFLWGTVALVLRIASDVPGTPLAAGLLGCLPVVVAAAWFEWRRRPAAESVRAALDAQNRCGGLLMAEPEADLSAWRAAVPAVAAPRLRWDARRGCALLGGAMVFAGLALFLPDRFTRLESSRPLEIGPLIQELAAQLEVLEEEQILDEKKAATLQEELARIRENASAADPARTWEALDHLKTAAADLARQAAEEALAKTESLTRAEALAAALEAMPGLNASEKLLTQAMRDLAALVQTAGLEEGLLAGSVPPELLAAAKNGGLSVEQLRELLKAIHANKVNLGECLARLAGCRLIDAELLAACQKAGLCPNSDGLAAFLAENGGDESLIAAVASYCRGGVTRGRGDAPMTWTDPSAEDGAAFKEQALPMGSLAGLTNALTIGLSRSAPEVTAAAEASQTGALGSGAAGGGSAHGQTVLPRHRGAVERYFKRAER